MHFGPLRDAEASAGEVAIISKIERLGNGANVFPKTATGRTEKLTFYTNPSLFSIL